MPRRGYPNADKMMPSARTILELALAAGVDPRTIRSVLRGANPPGPPRYARLRAIEACRAAGLLSAEASPVSAADHG